MKSIAELQELYETRLKPNLESLEGQRKSLKKRAIALIITFIAVLLIFIIADADADLKYLFYLIPVGLILFGYLLYKILGPVKVYRREFKEKVVKAIVNLINPLWNYDPYGHISEEQYRKSKLFPKGVDRYKGDDLVTGVIEKTDFRLSELHTEYKTESRDKDGHKRTKWHTIFKGLFAHIDFNKEIKGETLVLPDTAERMLGSIGRKLQSMSRRGKLIKLENVEFEKLFVVYGSDQIEARYILTPSMMEALVNIVKKYNRLIFCSFIGSRVYFAMPFKQDLFEPRIFKSGVRFDDMIQMNEQFSIIKTIIHEMNLNTRIWTKE
jgi:Protein of unknown function (DUF3137)